MLRRFLLRRSVFLVVLATLAGCQSSPKRLAAPKPYVPDDRTVEKLAQAHAHYAAGIIDELNEKPEAALEQYSQAVAKDPDNETLALDLARKLVQNKQPEKALELLSKSASRPKASATVFAQLGFVLAQLGKTDEAIAADRTAIKKAPDSIAGYQNLYLSLLGIKKNDEALKVLDEAGAQSKASAEFLIDVAELCLNFSIQVPSQREPARAKALALLKRADKLKPDNTPLRLRLAEGLATVGDADRAAQLYLQLLKELPDVPLLRERIHARLTDMYLKNKDHKHAMEQLQAILREDPANPQAYYFLGSIAFEENRMPDAIENFQKTILLNKNFEQAYYDLALAQLSLNKPGDALATLDGARNRFKENFVIEFWSGMAYSRQKEYKEALRHFTSAEIIARATDQKRLNKEFYFQLGAAYERSADFAEAEKYFQKCLDLAPDFAEALNYLGYMWAEHGMKLDKARDLIEKAVKAEPKNPAYLDSLGWVLFKLGKPKEGLDYVLKAVELTEEPDATLYDHLGDVYSALKQTDKAREAWQKSLSVEASEPVRKKLGADPAK
jgi:tetratricopeptide (TPR) repeat protein